MAALLTSVLDAPGKLTEYINDCEKNGARILPPCVNESKGGFTADGLKIRFGLQAIRNLGRAVLDAIIREREDNGNYSSLRDFCERLNNKGCGKKAVESLIKSGAFDCFPLNRRQMTENYERIMNALNTPSNAVIDGQIDFFATDKTPKKPEMAADDTPEYDYAALLEMEKEYLGIYVSGHPLKELEPYARARKARTIGEIASDPDGVESSAVCVVQSVKPHTARTGGKMLFTSLEDATGEIEGVVFPELCLSAGGYFKKGALLYITGKMSRKDDEPKLLISAATTKERFLSNCGRMDVYVKCPSFDAALRERVLKAANRPEFAGQNRLFLYFYDIGKRFAAKHTGVKIGGDLLDALSGIAGVENVLLG
jgi:DNA polymerase-3 subunit alpha